MVHSKKLTSICLHNSGPNLLQLFLSPQYGRIPILNFISRAWITADGMLIYGSTYLKGHSFSPRNDFIACLGVLHSLVVIGYANCIIFWVHPRVGQLWSFDNCHSLLSFNYGLVSWCLWAMMMDILFGSPTVYRAMGCGIFMHGIRTLQKCRRSFNWSSTQWRPHVTFDRLFSISKEGMRSHATLCKFLWSNANTVS